MSLKQALAANRWVARLLAVVTVSVLNFAWVVLTREPRSVGLPPQLALDAAGVWCMVMSVRTGMAQAGARRAAAEAEAKELHTLRAPDAGPDQCPVCGGYGLTALAEDDVFMDRGPLAKVVAYGWKRAHWDCAELVPYVAAPHFEPFEIDGHRTHCACKQCEREADHPGVYYRCKFCGTYRRTADRETARERLIEHAKVCPKRHAEPLVDRSFRSRDGLAPNSAGRVFTGPDGKPYVDYSPELRKRSTSPVGRSVTRGATVEEYADWLRGFMVAGGEPTHFYDYPFDRWDFEYAMHHFATCGERGARSRHIIVPVGVQHLGGDLGHNTIFFADGYRPVGSVVPVFTDPVFDAMWAAAGGGEARRQHAQQRWGDRR
jgi:hypothetical protein